jgi:hypothetical protein
MSEFELGGYGSLLDQEIEYVKPEEYPKEEEEKIIEWVPISFRKKMDDINSFRIKNDFILFAMDKKNKKFVKDYAKPLTKTILETYGLKELYGSEGMNGGFDERDEKMINDLWKSKDDTFIQLLWFICIPLVPGLYNWLTNPIKQPDGSIFPKITNMEWFKLFVKNVISVNLELWLNGKIDDSTYLNIMRTEYVSYVGIPIP